MNAPLALDENTGSCHMQPDESTRAVLCYVWLLEYNLACMQQRTQEILAEVQEGLMQNYREDRRHTAQVKQAALDAVVPYHRTGRKPTLEFMARKTKRILKEVQQC